MPQVALIVGAVASVVGTVASVRNSRKAAKKQEQQQQVATRRSRRQAIREAIIARSRAQATSEGAGTTGSSGAAGGIGSIGSRLGSDLGYSTQMSNLSADISAANQRASSFSALAQIGGTAFQFGRSRGATFGGFFPQRTPTAPPQNPLTTSLRPQERPF